MVIELSPKKIINGAVTVWNQPGPEVDIVMDLKNLTFKEGSIDEMFSFHVLDHLFEEEIVPAVQNWRKCLKKGRKLFVIVDDFEYLARAFVGGDINIKQLNEDFSHPTNIDRESLIRYYMEAGFPEESIHMWYGDVTSNAGLILEKKHYELIFDGNK